MTRRDAARISLIWLAWLGALLAALGIGLAAGAYTWAPGWLEHKGLWPLFAWDFNWYDFIGNAGYGIEGYGVTDGGGNVAKGNGQPAQCLGVTCTG